MEHPIQMGWFGGPILGNHHMRFYQKKWFNQIIQHMDLLLNFQRENSPKLPRSLTQMKDPGQNQFPGSLW